MAANQEPQEPDCQATLSEEVEVKEERNQEAHQEPEKTEEEEEEDPEIPILIGRTTQIGTLPSSIFKAFTTFPRDPPNPFHLHPLTSPAAAEHVLLWLTPTDPDDPRPLDLPTDTGTSITFEEALHIHNVCFQLRLDMRKRGDQVRDEIWLYIWDGGRQLTEEEFQMIQDLVPRDPGLVGLAEKRRGGGG